MCWKRFLVTAVLIPILAGCSTFAPSRPPTPTTTRGNGPVIGQAELEEIITG